MCCWPNQHSPEASREIGDWEGVGTCDSYSNDSELDSQLFEDEEGNSLKPKFQFLSYCPDCQGWNSYP